MSMLSRQVNKIVNVVFVIESLGKVKNQKPNNLITREKMKMLKNTHVIIVTVIN